MFINLYKYRPRIREEGANDRTPQEDWLTECLAACLRALWNSEPDLVVEVLKELFDERFRSELAVFLQGRAFRVETQISTDDRTRPDMALYAGKHALLVIENKVAHTAHIDQLLGYAKWLRNNCEPNSPQGVAFVTHYTRPPEEFGPNEAAFEGLSTKPTTWAALGKSFLRVTATLAQQNHARVLAQSFFEMLKELDMATEYPTNKTLAAAEIFLAEGEGVNALVNELRAETERLGNFHRQTTYECSPCFDLGYFAASRWCTDLFGEIGGSVYVGIWYPEVGTFKELILGASRAVSLNVEIDDGAKIFLNFETTGNIPVRSDDLPANWLKIDDDEIVVFRNISSFPGSADFRAKAMKSWIADRCDEFVVYRDSKSRGR